MDLMHPSMKGYLDGLVPERPAEMQAMEAYAAQESFPIIGPSAGYFCYLAARMIGARQIFELGSGYGYSTAWFARAVKENGGGNVYHTVWDEDLSKRAQRHLEALGLIDQVTFRVGEAVEALRATEGPFDLMFNDIDKAGYPASLPPIREKLRPGGLLLIDNMFFHGGIFDTEEKSASVAGVREVTRLVTEDPGWIASVIPLRDGVLMAMKQGD